jgi:hypothetical protein
VVVLVDELAFLTAYQPERDLRKRAEAAIATLTSQGRSVGVCVVGALQDPRKDVISLRNLFSTRIALRLDESDQVDMVLGDGARDRGALADQISPPPTGAGVGYVRLRLPRTRYGPRRLRHRRRHHGHGASGYLARRWPMREPPGVPTNPARSVDRPGPGRHRRAGPAGRMPPVRTPGRSTPRALTGTVPQVTPGRDAGRADGGRLARQVVRTCRRARRVPAPGPAAPDRHRHRLRRAGPYPVRAHPGIGVPVVRRAGPDPAGRAAAKAGTSTGNPSSTPDPATRGAAGYHRPGRDAGRQGPAGQRRPRSRQAGRADRRA